MAKSKRNAAPQTDETKEEFVAPTPAPQKSAGGSGTIQVNSDYAGHKHRGARGEFWQLLEEFDGRPVAEMAAAFANQPPKIQKGTTAYGSFQAWLQWFVKQGGCRITK